MHLRWSGGLSFLGLRGAVGNKYLLETSTCFVHLGGEEASHLSFVIDAAICNGQVLHIHEVGRGILVSLAAVLLLLEVVVIAVFQPAVVLALAGSCVCRYADVAPGCGCGLWNTRERSKLRVGFDDGLVVPAQRLQGKRF